MDVVIHQAKGMYPATKLLHGILKDQVETVTIFVIEKNRIASIATENDVVDSRGIMYAGFTSHGGNITANVQMSSLTPKISPDPKDLSEPWREYNSKCPNVKPDPKDLPNVKPDPKDLPNSKCPNVKPDPKDLPKDLP
jgi:hypothetical protein